MVLITITVTCLNGYSFQLTMRHTSISNIKNLIYLHFKSIEPTKALMYNRIPFKYHTHFQRLILGTDLLEEDVDLKHGDMLSLVIDTVLYERVDLNYTQTAQFMYNLHDVGVSWKHALNQLII